MIGGKRSIGTIMLIGALNRFERDRGQVPRSIRALVPVAQPSRSPAGELGNHYASVFVRLPIAVADPQVRLEVIARDMAALSGSGESRVAAGLIGLAGAVAPPIERRAVRWWSRRASLVASSLAGPTRPLSLAGHPLRSVIVWAPAPATVGLSFTFFGYAGTLHVGTIADAAVIDRPEELVAAFQQRSTSSAMALRQTADTLDVVMKLGLLSAVEQGARFVLNRQGFASRTVMTAAGAVHAYDARGGVRFRPPSCFTGSGRRRPLSGRCSPRCVLMFVAWRRRTCRGTGSAELSPGR